MVLAVASARCTTSLSPILTSGTNAITITCTSGSTGDGFLAPNVILDAIELIQWIWLLAWSFWIDLTPWGEYLVFVSGHVNTLDKASFVTYFYATELPTSSLLLKL